jgi:hypothetical protein
MNDMRNLRHGCELTSLESEKDSPLHREEILLIQKQHSIKHSAELQLTAS